ncbi:MAG: MFS transporter [Dehalococcoidia bacterium]
MTHEDRPTGMLAFTVVWFGQVISLLGTAMTGFALTIWVYQVTGEASALALVGIFSFAPTILVSPIAGALVDRWNRKLTMMLSDLAAGLSTAVVLLLFSTDNLQLWHLLATGAFSGTFQAFQFPAYSAAITTMLPKEQYGRASGMLSMAQSASTIFAPLLGAGLLTVIGITGVLTIDIVTFLVAIGTLLVVHIPQPLATEAGREARGSIWKESAYGFRYIVRRRSLLGLLLVFLSANLMLSFSNVVLPAMILARTGNDEIALGSVLSAFGVGGVLGSLLLSIWGGPKRRIHGVLTGITLASLPFVLMGLGRSAPVWAMAAFSTGFAIPIAQGASQAIWQSKIAPDVQGRVFAARGVVARISVPVSMMLAGPLADRVFEPSMMSGGALTATFGWLVGTGSGAGMALMFIISGVLGALVGLGGYVSRAVRDIEDILPDYDAENEAQSS